MEVSNELITSGNKGFVGKRRKCVEDEQRGRGLRREFGAAALPPVPAAAGDAGVVAPHNLTDIGVLLERLPVGDGVERLRARGTEQPRCTVVGG